MIRFDFWNNPLVVSAFRAKGKKQFPLAAYIVVLVAIGGFLEYFSRTSAVPWKTPWQQAHLVVVVALTAGASFVFAMVATQTSIAAEVSNKTLDFQRITGLSPAQVVVGKIFGEPALAYLLIPASFPIALFGVLRSDTIGLGSILLVYLNLFTFAILGGATGLLHPLESTPGKTGGGGGAATAWAVMFFIGAPYVIGSGFLIGRNPTAAFILGAFTPASVISGLYYGDVWRFSLHLFDWEIPYAIFSPIANLGLAFLLFSIMARRLKNSVETPLPKPLAYAALAVIDVLLVGFIVGEDPLKNFGGAGYRLASFAIAHTMFAAVLAFCVTPNREGVDSWIWGLRRSKRNGREWLVGDRSPNAAAVVVMSGIGAAAMALLLATSGGVAKGIAESTQLASYSAPFSNGVGALLAIVLFLSFGWLLQAAALVFKRLAAILLVGTTFLIIGMALAGVARNFNLPLAGSLSPIALTVAWMDPKEFGDLNLSPWPCIAAFGTAGLLGLAVVLRYQWGFRRIVEAKLRSMGVEPKPL